MVIAGGAANPRGVGHKVPGVEAISVSPYIATPLRQAHQAPITDGAVAMVVASERWLKSNPRARPLARVSGDRLAQRGVRSGSGPFVRPDQFSEIRWTTP